jgi:hypothetical protein
MQSHMNSPIALFQECLNFDLDTFDIDTFNYINKALQQDWANESVMKGKSAATVGICRWL